MADNSNQSSGKEDASQQLFEKVLSILDELSGKQSNFKLSIQDLKLNVGNSKITFNGEVNLDLASREAP